MPENTTLEMHDWTVTTRSSDGCGDNEQTVRGAYHQFSLTTDFIEFKNDHHAVVFTINSRDVISIRRI